MKNYNRYVVVADGSVVDSFYDGLIACDLANSLVEYNRKQYAHVIDLETKKYFGIEKENH